MTNKLLIDLYKNNQGKVSDKWSSYLHHYDRLFLTFKDQELKILEIGIENGGSLEIMGKYFSNAKVLVGCDININCSKLSFEDKRIKLVIGDVNETQIFEKITKIGSPFNIIIDDGSHKSSDVIKSFVKYFSNLADEGLYIIEDLHCSYWREYEGGLFYPYSSIQFFKYILDIINHEHWGINKTNTDILEDFSLKYGVKFSTTIVEKIESIQFFNSLCVIKKTKENNSELGPRLVLGRDASINDHRNLAFKKIIIPNQNENIFSKNQLKEKEKEITNLTQVTQAKEKEIVNLTQVTQAKEQEIEQQFRTIDTLNQTLITKDEKIHNLSSSLSQRTEETEQQQKTIETLNQSLDWKKQELEQNLIKNNTLENKIKEYDLNLYNSQTELKDNQIKNSFLENEIEKLKNTKLFKYTAILRNIYSKILRINKKNKSNFYQKPIIKNNDTKINLEENVKKKILNEKKDLHICFYLPQFHEIEENNKFWGKGFTEWTNVKKAKSLFINHDQPKVPHKSLGYYDLSEKNSLVKQVNLATSYGIDAFCYYAYLFDKDKALLDEPLNILLNNLDINQKFCICWANENWTKAWDGKDKELLIEQKYSEELLNFFPEYIEKFIIDKRYVKDRNRPLILIYRPEKIPNIHYWSDQWRNYFRTKLNIEILLCKVNSFSNQSAADINFDFNIEFPPNISRPKKIESNIYPKTLNIFDYNKFLDEEYHIQQNQKSLIRSAFPSWDNTPRRQENGTVFLNANPAKFYQYIELCKKFRSDIESLKNNYLFINSWNEWAEGAHIEPDNFNGFNNLTSNKISKKNQKKILFFIHDLHPHGTQYQTLAMAQFYKKYGYFVKVITFENGKLEKIFRENVNTIDILDIKKKSIFDNLVKNFVNDYDLIIYVSLAATKLIDALEYNNQVVLINELPKIIEEFGLQNDLHNVYKNAHKIYYPALSNKYSVENHFNIKNNNNSQIIIQQQGLLKINNFINKNKNECFEIFKEKYFKLPEDKKTIINIGFGDHRKGFDIFYQSSQLKENQNYFFLWIGNTNLKYQNNDNFKLIEHNYETGLFYKIADLFFLSSLNIGY